jgi:hypothetical protein
MSENWKLLFPVIHGVGNQNIEMQDSFLSDLVKMTKLKCTPAVVDNHLLPFLPNWSTQYFGESNAWLSLLQYDAARSRMNNSDLSQWNIKDRDLKDEIWQISLDKARDAIYASRPALALAAATAALPDITLVEALGKAAPWGHVYTLGREFQAHTLSDIIMYVSEDARVEIISRLLESTFDNLQGIPDDTKLYVVFCGHSLGSVIAYDLLRAIVTWKKEQRLTTEYGADKLLQRHQGISQLLDRLQPLGMITFGCPVSFFLFRRPTLIADRKLWSYICPQDKIDYFANNGPAPEVPWFWLNLWHPADFVAHRCEPYFNYGLPADRKFVEDILLPGRYQHGIDAHSSYWGFKASGIDMAAGDRTKSIIVDRLTNLLGALI